MVFPSMYLNPWLFFFFKVQTPYIASSTLSVTLENSFLASCALFIVLILKASWIPYLWDLDSSSRPRQDPKLLLKDYTSGIALNGSERGLVPTWSKFCLRLPNTVLIEALTSPKVRKKRQ